MVKSNSKKRAASSSSSSSSSPAAAAQASTSKKPRTSSSTSKSKSKTSTRRSARASSSRSQPPTYTSSHLADEDEEQDELEQDELASSTGAPDPLDPADNDDAATTTTADASAALDNDLDSTLTGYGLLDDDPPAASADFMHAANNTRIIDLYTAPKPFKNPAFKKSKLRAYKTAKQVVTAQATAAAERDLIERMGLSPEEAKRVAKVGDPAFAPLWNKVRAPPFTRPQRKYCDLTGLPTNYTDPVSGLHYYDSSVYQQIKAMSSAAVQKCLAMRNKAVVI